MHTVTKIDQIKNILLDLTNVGLLRIRAFGNSGDAKACAEEADHIHNLPHIVQSFRLEEVDYYYNISRHSFVGGAKGSVAQFGALWEELGRLLGEGREQGS